MKPPLIILTGPTAVGKTALSVSLAKAVGGEIISADSMQVYRYMDIGSAKITKEEMDGISHYLIDVLDPLEPFSAARFQEMAQDAIRQIYANKHIPIVAGGTGFYIQALLYDIDFEGVSPNGEEAYRHFLEQTAKEKGNDSLYEILKTEDPEYASQTHPNNLKRIIRALEYIHLTGRKFSDYNREEREKVSPYQFAYFVLTMDRAALYARINERVNQMMEKGLVTEVQALAAMGCKREMTSMQGLGYKEILDYLDGVTDLAEAVERIKQNTRHFAKRQLTWFRRERDVIWIDKDQFCTEESLLSCMLQILREKGIILDE